MLRFCFLLCALAVLLHQYIPYLHSDSMFCVASKQLVGSSPPIGQRSTLKHLLGLKITLFIGYLLLVLRARSRQHEKNELGMELFLILPAASDAQ